MTQSLITYIRVVCSKFLFFLSDSDWVYSSPHAPPTPMAHSNLVLILTVSFVIAVGSVVISVHVLIAAIGLYVNCKRNVMAKEVNARDHAGE